MILSTSLHSAPTIVHNLIGASLGTSDSTQDHDLNNKESTHRLARHNEESCCRNRQPWTLKRQTQKTATAATAGYEERRNVWGDTGERGRRNVVRKEYPGDWTCVLVQDLPTRTPSTWLVETVLVWLPPQDVLGSFCVGGRVVRANSLERRPSVPIWTLSICTLFVRSEADMMD